jgi:hypothetical protein
MSAPTSEPTITISLGNLEALIRRVVQGAVHQELTRMLVTPSRALLDYWEHEGPDDPAGDEALLQEALVLVERYEENREGWKTLEEFEAELTHSENLHELQG